MFITADLRRHFIESAAAAGGQRQRSAGLGVHHGPRRLRRVHQRRLGEPVRIRGLLQAQTAFGTVRVVAQSTLFRSTATVHVVETRRKNIRASKWRDDACLDFQIRSDAQGVSRCQSIGWSQITDKIKKTILFSTSKPNDNSCAAHEKVNRQGHRRSSSVGISDLAFLSLPLPSRLSILHATTKKTERNRFHGGTQHSTDE